MIGQTVHRPTRGGDSGGRRQMLRIMLGFLGAIALLAVSSVPFAYADASVNLSCSEGTNLDLTLDPSSLLELEDSVQAMVTYPAGIACSVSQLPSTSGGIASLWGGLVQQAAAYGGPNDVLAGALQLMVPGCPGGGDTNINVTAHTAAKTTTPASGQMTQNTASDDCHGHISADVDCLRVTPPATPTSPAIATVNGTIKESTGVYATIARVGTGLRWTFTDFPSPMQDEFAGDQTPDACAGVGSVSYLAESGNVIVKSGS